MIFRAAEMLEKLPEDLVYEILDLLDVTTRARLTPVSKSYRQVAFHNWHSVECSTQRDDNHVFGCLENLVKYNTQSMRSVCIRVNWKRDYDNRFIPGRSLICIAISAQLWDIHSYSLTFNTANLYCYNLERIITHKVWIWLQYCNNCLIHNEVQWYCHHSAIRDVDSISS